MHSKYAARILSPIGDGHVVTAQFKESTLLIDFSFLISIFQEKKQNQTNTHSQLMDKPTALILKVMNAPAS